MFNKLNAWLTRWFAVGKLTEADYIEYEKRLEEVKFSKEQFLRTMQYNMEHPEFRRRYSKEFTQ